MSNLLFHRLRLLQVILLTLLLGAGCIAKAQPGTLDFTYGTNGIVLTNLGDDYPEGYCSVLDAQGRLVVGGRVYVYQNDEWHAFLARFQTDGSLDPSFGNGGFIIDSTINGWIFGLTIASDGKILACGSVLTGQSTYDYIIFRYNQDGTIDNTFSQDGSLLVDFGGLHRNQASGIHEQADGKILVNGGFMYDQQGVSDLRKIGICRLMPNGTLDPTYGNNGLVIEDLGSNNANCFNSKIDANGKLVVAGWRGLSGNFQGVLSRYNTDGTLDATFGNAGLAFLNIALPDYLFFSTAIADDGSIYTCGTATTPVTLEWDFIIAKFTPAGLVDTSFANNGFLHLEFTNVHQDEAHDLVLQQDGKLLVIGQVQNSNNNDTWEFATLRLNQNGTLDTSFGDNGLAVFPVGSDDSYPVSVELQSDGKALLVGFSDDVDNGLAIARILTGGNLGIVDFESEQTEVLLYPNPIAAKASLDFELTKSAAVSAELFTSHGISVEKIMDNANVKSGKHKIELDLSNFAAGVYVLKLTVGDALKTIKIIKS